MTVEPAHGYKAVAWAVLPVIASALARTLLVELTGATLVFATFYPAIMFATLGGGLWPGIFALLSSAALAWFSYMPPAFSFRILSAHHLPDLLLFAGCGGLIVWMANAYRGALNKLTEQQQVRDLLLRELEHRGRNTAAVAKSLISLSLKGHPEIATALNARLATLFATNMLLTQSLQKSVPIENILKSELEPYGIHRCALTGPDVQLLSSPARTLALVVHELATNAAKYGSLSNADGQLRIEWSASADMLSLSWSEAGGPKTTPPKTTGFGTKLIETLVRQEGGTVATEYNESGFACRLQLGLGPPS